MIAGVFNEFGGQNNYTIQLDRTLPFISGKVDLVRKIFALFISDLNESFGRDWKSAYLYVSYTQDKNCWIFNFQPINSLPENAFLRVSSSENGSTELGPFSLMIPKSSIRDSFRNSDISQI